MSFNNSTLNSIYNNNIKNSDQTTSWVRNPYWLTLPSMTSGDSKLIGLYAIYPNAIGDPNNFAALCCSGNYTVDWGDGTIENFNQGINAYHNYDYNSSGFNNTNIPVSFVDSGDLIQKTSHGYQNGSIVNFYNIVSTTGIAESQNYYVVNANPNNFQIANAESGNPISFSIDGSGFLLPYKQAILTVTPQSGQNLTHIDLYIKHNQPGLQRYTAGWLDIKLGSSNLLNLKIGDINFLNISNDVENIEILNLGLVNNCNSLFANLSNLKNISISNCDSITNTSNMFYLCQSLNTVPIFNTINVSGMSSMFYGCINLKSIPLFNTSNVIYMDDMFQSCRLLRSIPLFDMAKTTITTRMFQACISLESIPLFNTSNVINMATMFSSCTKLKSIPLLDMSNVTVANNMFASCQQLTSVPLFNTSGVKNMSQMFTSCLKLKSIPLLNTSSVNSINGIFFNCQSLESIHLLDTSKCTTMGGSFRAGFVESCTIIDNFPLLDTSQATEIGEMFGDTNINIIPKLNFSNASSNSTSPFQQTGANITKGISAIYASGGTFTHSVTGCKLSKTALKLYMDNLGSGTGKTFSITNNWGVGSSYIKTVGTTAQSTTVTCSDTSNLASGMMITGTGTGIGGVSVSSDVTANTLTLNNHGLSNGQRISFSSIGTTTGVNINIIYYVVNATTNNFQISLSPNGSAIDLTGSNSTMTLRYTSYINSINTNVNVILDTPATSTNASTSWTFKTVDAYGALLKGWAVTY